MSSHADRRTVATDALETLGTILGEGERRDAIHLAVEPAVAGEDLRPGEHVGLLSPGVAAGEGACGKPVGIVDPFLPGGVRKGQRFWLVVYPRQVTSLRHVWTHPDFPGEPDPGAAPGPDDARRRDSERWLRDFAETHDCPDFDALIAAATGEHHRNEVHGDDYYGSSNDGEYLFFRGYDAHGEIPPEFWTHVEIYGGRTIPGNRRPRWFSCSC